MNRHRSNHQRKATLTMFTVTDKTAPVPTASGGRKATPIPADVLDFAKAILDVGVPSASATVIRIDNPDAPASYLGRNPEKPRTIVDETVAFLDRAGALLSDGDAAIRVTEVKRTKTYVELAVFARPVHRRNRNHQNTETTVEATA